MEFVALVTDEGGLKQGSGTPSLKPAAGHGPGRRHDIPEAVSLQPVGRATPPTPAGSMSTAPPPREESSPCQTAYPTAGRARPAARHDTEILDNFPEGSRARALMLGPIEFR